MEKTHTTFAVKIGIIVAILVVAGGSYALFRNYTAIVSEAHLQEVPYVDEVVGYSMTLPQGWSVKGRESWDTFAAVVLHNASSTDAKAMKISIDRYARTPEMTAKIDDIGVEEYSQELMNDLWSGREREVVTNEIKEINGIPFTHIESHYVGTISKNKVVQHMYVTFTDSFYYRIGIDVREDVWKKNKESLLASIETFKIIP